MAPWKRPRTSKAGAKRQSLRAAAPAIRIHDGLHDCARRRSRCSPPAITSSITRPNVMSWTTRQCALGVRGPTPGAECRLRRDESDGDVQQGLGGVAHPGQPLHPRRHIAHLDRSGHASHQSPVLVGVSRVSRNRSPHGREYYRLNRRADDSRDCQKTTHRHPRPWAGSAGVRDGCSRTQSAPEKLRSRVPYRNG